jgi:hypothetical protein
VSWWITWAWRNRRSVKHLKFLLESGLITARPQWRSTWYALADPDAPEAWIIVAKRMLHVTDVHDSEAELEVS